MCQIAPAKASLAGGLLESWAAGRTYTMDFAAYGRSLLAEAAEASTENATAAGFCEAAHPTLGHRIDNPGAQCAGHIMHDLARTQASRRQGQSPCRRWSTLRCVGRASTLSAAHGIHDASGAEGYHVTFSVSD